MRSSYCEYHVAERERESDSFSLSSPVPKEVKMDVEGAMLMMAIFDYDMVGSNDLCGLCVIPCKRIPKLGGKGSLTRPTGPERKNYHLPLFKVQPTAAFR